MWGSPQEEPETEALYRILHVYVLLHSVEIQFVGQALLFMLTWCF
jgi:hypothetical protein